MRCIRLNSSAIPIALIEVTKLPVGISPTAHVDAGEFRVVLTRSSDRTRSIVIAPDVGDLPNGPIERSVQEAWRMYLAAVVVSWRADVPQEGSV